MKEGKPLSNEQYFYTDIQKEAYEIWQTTGKNPQECWDIAKSQVIKRGFRPKAVAIITVVDEKGRDE